MSDLSSIRQWAAELERKLTDVSVQHETSPTRTITLSRTLSAIDNLTEIENTLLREAATSLQAGAFRASIVLSWSAFMAATYRSMSNNNFSEVNALWPKLDISSDEELREKLTDFVALDFLKSAKLLSKNEARIAHGLLAQRNRAAHPEPNGPELNEALAYLAEITKYLPRVAKHGR